MRAALCSDKSLEGYEGLSDDVPKFRNQEQGSRVGWVELISPLVHRATEKPGCSGRGKVQSAPGLAIVQIVVPRRPRAHTANE